MKTREKFKRRIIELIQGLIYEDAVKKEGYFKDCDFCNGVGICADCEDNRGKIIEYSFPITVARIMQAFENKEVGYYTCQSYIDGEISINIGALTIRWKLLKENGQEADDDFQSDETIEKLYKLIS